MNIRSSGVATCLLVAVTAGCGTVTASSPGTPSAGTGVSSSCQQLAGGALTLASNGKTYCIRVGEKFDVYLSGTVSSRWMPPLASSDVVKPVPNGAGSLIAGLTLESFVAVRPGQVLITSIRPPCSGRVTVRNEAEPKHPLPRVYPLRSCPPTGRFSVSITVVR